MYRLVARAVLTNLITVHRSTRTGCDENTRNCVTHSSLRTPAHPSRSQSNGSTSASVRASLRPPPLESNLPPSGFFLRIPRIRSKDSNTLRPLFDMAGLLGLLRSPRQPFVWPLPVPSHSRFALPNTQLAYHLPDLRRFPQCSASVSAPTVGGSKSLLSLTNQHCRTLIAHRSPTFPPLHQTTQRVQRSPVSCANMKLCPRPHPHPIYSPHFNDPLRVSLLWVKPCKRSLSHTNSQCRKSRDILATSHEISPAFPCR